MTFFRKYLLTFAGILIGGICGYLYYRHIGCATETCPITSKPVNSTLYGTLLFGLLFDIFEKKSK